jgi:hypothetical protein
MAAPVHAPADVAAYGQFPNMLEKLHLRYGVPEEMEMDPAPAIDATTSKVHRAVLIIQKP